MPDVIVTLTQEQHDAIAAGLPDDPKAPKSDEERVEVYLQGQVDAICAQHVLRENGKRLAQKGLPRALAEIGLKPDELAAVEAVADAKAPK